CAPIRSTRMRRAIVSSPSESPKRWRARGCSPACARDASARHRAGRSRRSTPHRNGRSASIDRDEKLSVAAPDEEQDALAAGALERGGGLVGGLHPLAVDLDDHVAGTKPVPRSGTARPNRRDERAYDLRGQ